MPGVKPKVTPLPTPYQMSYPGQRNLYICGYGRLHVIANKFLRELCWQESSRVAQLVDCWNVKLGVLGSTPVLDIFQSVGSKILSHILQSEKYSLYFNS